MIENVLNLVEGISKDKKNPAFQNKLERNDMSSTEEK